MRGVLLWSFLAVVLLCGMSGVVSAEAIMQGDNGDDVMAVQTRLNNLGYNAGAVDGVFGDQMKDAVKAYQTDQGLDVDGVVGPSTYRALMGRDMQVSRGYRGGARNNGGSSVARKLINTAMSYLGTPYVFGGTGSGGFDCSGFVYSVFAQYGVGLPRMADEQYYESGRSVSRNALQPGDLVFFETYEPGPSHVGIYIGSDEFIHASSGRGEVTISSLNQQYYLERYIGAKRVL